MATLYIVATPIGNLKDITLRALEVLKSVDYILSEDTRVTKKLLSHYNIKTPLTSYHQHSTPKKIEEINNLLKQGKNLALVTDAGTPGISDPGNELISLTIQQFNHSDNLNIIPIPGASALTAAASISGLPMDKFLFLGYPPAKKKRKKFFGEVVHSPHPVIFYESPHRILRSLRDLYETDTKLIRDIVVCKELTKMFEKVYRGDITSVMQTIERDGARGEYTVIVANKKG